MKRLFSSFAAACLIVGSLIQGEPDAMAIEINGLVSTSKIPIASASIYPLEGSPCSTNNGDIFVNSSGQECGCFPKLGGTGTAGVISCTGNDSGTQLISSCTQVTNFTVTSDCVVDFDSANNGECTAVNGLTLVKVAYGMTQAQCLQAAASFCNCGSLSTPQTLPAVMPVPTSPTLMNK